MKRDTDPEQSDEPAEVESVAPERAATITPQMTLFGAAEPLTLVQVRLAAGTATGLKGTRALVRRSEVDPLMSMLELAQEARLSGDKSLAFARFEACLPYVWARLVSLPGVENDELPAGTSGAVAMKFEWRAPE
jgi:hypothetical protein